MGFEYKYSMKMQKVGKGITVVCEQPFYVLRKTKFYAAVKKVYAHHLT